MSQRITFYTTLVQREKLDEWLEKQKSIGSFVLPIPIVPLVNISSMPYLESEQQAAVTDAQETTANEQTKPSTKRLRLNSKITGKNIKLLNKSLVYRLLFRHNFSG